MKKILNFFAISIFIIGLSMQQADFRNLPNNSSTNDSLSDSVNSTDRVNDTTGTSDNHTSDSIEPKPNSTVSNEVILLGFDDFKKVNKIFTFNINLKKVNPDFKIFNLTFPVYLYHKKRLRFLDERQVSTCVCDDSKETVECQCRGSCENENFTRIELIEDFSINGEKNNLALSSLAEEQKSKINQQNKDIFQKDSVVAIMKDATLEDYSSKFNLKGSKDNINNFPTSNSNLMVMKHNNKTTNFSCSGETDSNDYILHCNKSSLGYKLDLNNAIAEINGDGKEKMIIQFKNGDNSFINSNTRNDHYINKSKKKGLSTGGIIAIIIPTILVLFGVLALAFMLNRNPNSQLQSPVAVTSSSNIIEKNNIN
jgi:hypothetical protein